jgi:S-adenosylmethionine-diacylglycerol 3-amino-3-carboxypropyl transferase
LLEEKTESERNEFYDRRWNNRRWRFLFKVFFSRLVMGRLGRDPEFFRYVEGSVADRILERTKYALTTLPTHANPFLTYILTGNFGLALPRYLRPEIFPGVCSGLDRLILFNGPAQEAATVHGAGGFDGYNLSDIFEYLDAEMGERVYGGLLDHARPGARYAYWNMLVPRSCPAAHAARIQSLGALSDGLFARDQAFFYSRFVVEEVRG